MGARVTELMTYPIKGCAPVLLATAELTWAGLEHDRTFMVVTADGEFLSQRKDPRLAVVRPQMLERGARMRLAAPGLETIELDVDSTSPARPVQLFGNVFTGIDQGDDASGWFAEHLGRPARLVRVSPDHQRVSSGAIPGTSGYADSCAVLLTSHSSLAELNRRIAARDGGADRMSGTGGADVPMNRFRPNIVAGGWDEPHTEDSLRRVVIAGAELGFAKIAIRCAVTMVDQPTGTKAGPEPLRTLATYRRAEEGGDRGVAFGSKFVVLRPGTVSVGDEISAVVHNARNDG